MKMILIFVALLVFSNLVLAQSEINVIRADGDLSLEKTINYIVVSGTRSKHLEFQVIVSRRINEGWKPVGGLLVMEEPHISKREYRYFQALMRD